MKIPNVDEDVKKQEFSYCLWDYKCHEYHGKKFGRIWQSQESIFLDQQLYLYLYILKKL